jgi:hypothetical protein
MCRPPRGPHPGAWGRLSLPPKLPGGGTWGASRRLLRAQGEVRCVSPTFAAPSPASRSAAVPHPLPQAVLGEGVASLSEPGVGASPGGAEAFPYAFCTSLSSAVSTSAALPSMRRGMAFS